MVDNFAYVTNTMFFFEQRNLYLIPVRGRGKSEAADRNRFHRFTRPNRKFKFVSSSRCEFYRILEEKKLFLLLLIAPSSKKFVPRNVMRVDRWRLNCFARLSIEFWYKRVRKRGVLFEFRMSTLRYIPQLSTSTKVSKEFRFESIVARSN